MDPYTVINSETTYSGRIIDVSVDEITLPGGGSSFREVVLRGKAAAVLPVLENGNVVFVRQYRHPFSAMMLEVPAGMLEHGEDPAECAARELEEETGYKTGMITPLTVMYPSVGFCTEVIYIFFAEGLTRGTANPDADEFIEIVEIPFAEAVAMAHRGEIRDSKTLIALFMYKSLKGI